MVWSIVNQDALGGESLFVNGIDEEASHWELVISHLCSLQLIVSFLGGEFQGVMYWS